MSDILRDFDKKNEVPKVKIPKFATGGICNDAIFPKLDAFSQIDEIVKDIRDRQDNTIAMEFTKCIGELLRKNGVTPKITEYQKFSPTFDKIGEEYGVTIDELDFSEHDKVFEDKIKSLQDECAKLHKQLMETEKDMQDEIVILNKQIADLQWELAGKEVDEEKTEPVKESLPSMEWYENRHQSDCIEINRLNTTIDVLIHKVEYLRQFVGLE